MGECTVLELSSGKLVGALCIRAADLWSTFSLWSKIGLTVVPSLPDLHMPQNSTRSGTKAPMRMFVGGDAECDAQELCSCVPRHGGRLLARGVGRLERCSR